MSGIGEEPRRLRRVSVKRWQWAISVEGLGATQSAADSGIGADKRLTVFCSALDSFGVAAVAASPPLAPRQLRLPWRALSDRMRASSRAPSRGRDVARLTYPRR